MSEETKPKGKVFIASDIKKERVWLDADGKEIPDPTKRGE